MHGIQYGTKNEVLHEIFVTDCTCLPGMNRGSPGCYRQHSRNYILYYHRLYIPYKIRVFR
jgi:hypothetical protein